MLELKNINKNYNPGTVNELCLFENFNLTIQDGEFVSVVGSNGSGKTSMLNIICGTIPVDSGSILVNGTDIVNKKDYIRHRKIGRVYQDPAKGPCPRNVKGFELRIGKSDGNKGGSSFRRTETDPCTLNGNYESYRIFNLR